MNQNNELAANLQVLGHIDSNALGDLITNEGLTTTMERIGGVVQLKTILADREDFVDFFYCLTEEDLTILLTQPDIMEVIQYFFTDEEDLFDFLDCVLPAHKLLLMAQPGAASLVETITTTKERLLEFLDLLSTDQFLLLMNKPNISQFLQKILSNSDDLRDFIEHMPIPEELLPPAIALELTMLKTAVQHVADLIKSIDSKEELLTQIKQLPPAECAAIITHPTITALIIQNVKECDELLILIKALPVMSRARFLFSLGGIPYLKNIIKNKEELIAVLGQIPQSHARILITQPEGIAYCKALANNNKQELTYLLDQVPDKYRLSLITHSNEIEYLVNMLGIVDFFQYLPPLARLHFLENPGAIGFLKAKIHGARDLSHILACLLEQYRLPLIHEFGGARYIKTIIRDNLLRFIDLFKTIPEASRMSLIDELGGSEYIKTLVRDADYLSELLQMLPEQNRAALTEQLMSDHDYAKIIIADVNRALSIILRALPNEENKKSLLKLLLGNNDLRTMIKDQAQDFLELLSRTSIAPQDVAAIEALAGITRQKYAAK